MSTEKLTEKFGKNGHKGGAAEEHAYRKLLKVYDEVVDLREDHEAQYHGIDFRIQKKDWKHPYDLDVKGNLDNKGRMFFIELRKGNIPGWLHSSASHRIYHVNVESDAVVWYDLHRMRMRLLDYGISTRNELLRISANDTLIYDLIRTTW